LYGIREAAGYLAVPPSTLANWAYGYEHQKAGVRVAGKPVVTAIRPERRHEAAVPFVGLAEAYALAAFRQAGVPLQRIRPAIDALHRELGLKYALASRRLYTDGAEILYDYAQHADGTPEAESARELVVVRNNQRVFADVVARYLRRVDFAPDGYAQVIHLPQYRVADVTIDPDHAFGRPRFAHGGAGLSDVIDLFVAGEPVDTVAEEFGLTRDEVRTPCVQPPEQQPKFFLDRSLGPVAVPSASRSRRCRKCGSVRWAHQRGTTAGRSPRRRWPGGMPGRLAA
jgi:uncharacterized protein (DUF433 family)